MKMNNEVLYILDQLNRKKLEISVFNTQLNKLKKIDGYDIYLSFFVEDDRNQSPVRDRAGIQVESKEEFDCIVSALKSYYEKKRNDVYQELETLVEKLKQC
jgi:hypothetical protein